MNSHRLDQSSSSTSKMAGRHSHHYFFGSVKSVIIIWRWGSFVLLVQYLYRCGEVEEIRKGMPSHTVFDQVCCHFICFNTRRILYHHCFLGPTISITRASGCFFYSSSFFMYYYFFMPAEFRHFCFVFFFLLVQTKHSNPIQINHFL